MNYNGLPKRYNYFCRISIRFFLSLNCCEKGSSMSSRISSINLLHLWKKKQEFCPPMKIENTTALYDCLLIKTSCFIFSDCCFWIKYHSLKLVHSCFVSVLSFTISLFPLDQKQTFLLQQSANHPFLVRTSTELLEAIFVLTIVKTKILQQMNYAGMASALSNKNITM